MKPICIIGIGSPHGTDQTGWQLTEILKQDHALQTLAGGQIRFLICEHPGIMLLDYMTNCGYAILIDAIEGGQRGKIIHVDKQQLLGNHSLFSTHNLGVRETLLLGHQLNALPQHLTLFGVEVGDTSMEYLPQAEIINELKSLICSRIQTHLLSE